MSDTDKTMMSVRNTPPPPAGGNKILMAVIALLIAFILLLMSGIGFLLLSDSASPIAANTPSPTETIVAAVVPSDTPTVSVTNTPTTPLKISIKNLLFSAKPLDQSQKSDYVTRFKVGIKEIYFIFDYTNLTPQDTWTRVWYLDGKESLRSEPENWSGQTNGTFDYPLGATGGEPLPVGEWKLEILFNDELLATGSFTIEGPPTATPTMTMTPTPIITETPTLTPTVKAAAIKPKGGGTYQLAYTKWDGSLHNLYVADTNGKNETFIIQRGAGPSWSPNGKQMFFFGEQGINQQLRDGRIECDFGTISGGLVGIDLPTPLGDICRDRYGVWLCERHNNDQTVVCLQNNLTILQNLDWKEGSARWASVSPDGRTVAYDGRPGGDYRIYFRNILDPSQTRFELIGENGSWSPNGQQMVYRSGRDNKSGIWISNWDDTGHRLITNDGTDDFPTWSPDGKTIAFSRKVNDNVDIYTIGIDGSNLKQLTDTNGHDTLPVYTPGGDLIFRSARGGSWAIWKMGGDGSNQQQIIGNANVGPDWAFSRMDVK